MKRWLSLLLLGSLTLGAAESVPEPSAAEFLESVRRGRGQETCGVMNGTLRHRRAGGEDFTEPLFFAVLILRDRMMAQVIAGEREGYYVSQTYGGAGSVIPMQKQVTAPILERAGVRPSDLALKFLFWDLVRELPQETLRGMIPCRVFLLRSPENGESAVAAIAKEYAFPLRVEFFASPDGSGSCVRTLEPGAFRKSGDLYYLKTLDLSGSGWRSRIEFDDAQLSVLQPGEPAPKIFRELPAK